MASFSISLPCHQQEQDAQGLGLQGHPLAEVAESEVLLVKFISLKEIDHGTPRSKTALRKA
jgi:hypothetical protein